MCRHEFRFGKRRDYYVRFGISSENKTSFPAKQVRIGLIGTRGYPYVYSGYETFVAELAPRLVDRGHSVTVYCHRGLFKERPPKFRGIRLVYLPALEYKILSQFSHSFLSTLHSCFMNYDIILFVNSANGPFGFLTRAFGKCTAINVDGLEWLRPKWRGLGAKYFWTASYLSSRLFDVIITDCERMAEIYRREFRAESVTIAYGANPGYSVNATVLSTWGLSPGKYYLVVARLVPDNNADVIVRGFEKSDSLCKLVILGDVPYSDSFADAVRSTRDSRILFPGYVKDKEVLRELYCNASAYIHGHEFGGTNPSLLQALANGCCVLALDTSFSREVLNNEKHGLYFQKNPDSLRSLIARIESDPSLASHLRASARSRIEEKYMWEQITDQYEELLQSLTK